MESRKISLRRRQLLIAGFAGTAASASLYAGQLAGLPAAARKFTAMEGAAGLVISGRILARDGAPLAGATVEVLNAAAAEVAATATTDGDGRFYAAVASGHHGHPRKIHYRVSRNGQTLAAQQLHFARGREVAERQAGRLHRDDSGAWRAAFGLTLA